MCSTRRERRRRFNVRCPNWTIHVGGETGKMTMRRVRGMFAMLMAVGLLAVACSKSEERKESASEGSQPNAETAMPEVGQRAIPESQYKPVAGRFGGRIVRDTLGEPKSFNPVTAGETSTTEYTNRMFQGLTEINAFTGD